MGGGGGVIPLVKSVYVSCNRRSSEIQGTALGKCLRAWTCIYIGPGLRVKRRVGTLLLGARGQVSTWAR